MLLVLATISCGSSPVSSVGPAGRQSAAALPTSANPSALCPTPVPPPSPLPTATPSPLPTATPTTSGPCFSHRVRPGESLSQIGQLYGVDPDEIAAANHLLYAGQLLTIPLTATTVAHTARYVFPVQPPSAASYGEYHHDYPATDILAPFGSPVVAVTDGVVDELGPEDRWDPNNDDPELRGGRFVSIVGDDGVRYYSSHLSAVIPWLQPGMRVVAGQLIGYVGQSGNARGTDPHVHFGISPPTHPGDWAVRRGVISPYPYLRAWEQGQELSPVLP